MSGYGPKAGAKDSPPENRRSLGVLGGAKKDSGEESKDGDRGITNARIENETF